MPHNKIRSPALAWLLLALLSFFQLSLAYVVSPDSRSGLQRRAKANGAAGFGVELEIRGITLQNDALVGQTSTAQQLKDLKGAAMQGEDYAKHSSWMLSAEQAADNIAMVIPEFIVAGETVGLGNGDVSSAIDGVLSYMDTWKPAVNSPQKDVSIKGFNGKWTIKSPNTYAGAAINWGIQVTAPMPLEGIDALFESARGPSIVKSPLLGAGKQKNMHWVQDTHFSTDGKSNDNPQDFPRSMATAEVRAFFSLVLTYAKGASHYTPSKDSPKMISSIMPRTDFAFMYKIIQPKIQKALDCQSLYDILKVLAKFDGDGSQSKDLGFNLDTAKLDYVGYDGAPFSLSVKQWIDALPTGVDKLAEADKKYSDNQIGRFSRGEGIYNNPARNAPLFEFRELTAFGTALKDRIKAFEDETIRLHKRFPTKRDVTKTLEARATESAKSCSRCKKGQATTGKDGECQDCPTGKVPSDDQKTCVDEKKCNTGEAKTGPNGECQKCPTGKVPSDDGKTCVDDKKCAAGEAKTGTDGACQKCPDGKVPSDDGKTCVDDKKCGAGEAKTGTNGACQKCGSGKVPAADGKSCVDDKSVDKDKDKKSARTKWCLGFLAGSGMIAGAEALRTDEGIAALEDAATNYPTDVTYGNLDYALSDSNMNVDLDKSGNIPPEWLAKRDIVHEDSLDKRGAAGKVIGQLIRKIIDTVEKIKAAAQAAGEAGSKVTQSVGKTNLKSGSDGRAGKPDDVKLNDLKKLSPDERKGKAKESLDKLKGDPAFASCLAMVVPVNGLTVFDAVIHRDGVPDGGFKGQDNPIGLVVFENEDNRVDSDTGNDGSNHYWVTYPDTLWHDNRILEGQCQSAAPMNGQISAYAVNGGCCTFYADDKCTSPIFAATDREDMNLKGNANDHIQAFSCVKDAGCAGVPNLQGYGHGQCGIHVTQYQSSDPGKVPIDFDVRVIDGYGQEIFHQERAQAVGDVLTFNIPRMARDMKVDVSAGTRSAEGKGPADDNAKFSFGSDSWWTSDTNRCKFGEYDGSKGHPGKVQGDCGFAC